LIDKAQFIDKSFNLENISNYHLSLQVNLKGFSFCILDRERNKFIALGNYYFSKITSYNVLIDEIGKVFASEPILQYKYLHVKLLFATPKFSFIPSPFFDPDKKTELFKLNHQLKKTEILLNNFIYGNSSYVLFAMPEFIHAFFKSKFSELKVYHHSCPLIEELLLKEKLSTENKHVFINILPGLFDFIVIDNGKLQLFNSFAYNSETDFQYFILNTFDQLKLSTIDVPVSILGFIKRDDLRIENLKKFIKRIDYLAKPNHFEYAYGFNDFPDYYFINLINLYQCG